MDYEKLGLKVGLEIHQQLNTKKLFCNCSSRMKEEKLIYEVERKLRPVVSELGEFDRAALFEFFRNRTFVYHGYENEACLVELDEEPPHYINKEALDISLSIALMLNLNIPEELWVMRKTVLDGSAITSFQRTILIGYGKPKFKGVRIKSICLEEDAAKLEKREGNKVFYSLSRLGIPLIEIGTEPDIKTPQQCKEFAEELGLLLRTFNVKRGIGTIRQDVNVSIKGGARVEIKGWQELGSIDKLVENEVRRQLTLLEIRDELKKIGAYVEKPNEVSEILGMNIPSFILILRKFRSVWHRKIYGNKYEKTFRDEIFEYGTAYHSFVFDDEESEMKEEFEKLKKKFDVKDDDIIILIYGGEEKRSAESMFERIKYCLIGVPEETRKPRDDATTSYSRPLPGAARMYPETDHPPIRISEKYLETLKKKLPESLNEKKKRLEKIISKELASQIIRSKYLHLFEKIIKKSKNSEFIKVVASILTSTLKEMKREGFETEKLKDEDFLIIFGALKKDKISKKTIPDILKLVLKGEKVKSAIKKHEKIGREELRKIVKRIYENNKNVPFSKLIGLVMKEVRGKAEGKEVIEELKKLNKK